MAEFSLPLPVPFLAVPGDPPIPWENWLESFTVYLDALGYRAELWPRRPRQVSGAAPSGRAAKLRLLESLLTLLAPSILAALRCAPSGRPAPTLSSPLLARPPPPTPPPQCQRERERKRETFDWAMSLSLSHTVKFGRSDVSLLLPPPQCKRLEQKANSVF